MKDWDDLQTVLALGRLGTMKGAAGALGVSETTIARRLRRLAKDDIATLFVRDGQRWTPTELGDRLIRLAEAIEAQILEADTAFEESTDALTGTLVISALSFINSHFLSTALPGFTAKNPDLQISIDASDERVSLAFREADLALRLARPREGRLIGRLIALVPMVAFTYGGPGQRNWVGLPAKLDWTPEMTLGHEVFSRPPQLRLDSFESIQNAALAVRTGGVAPSCFLRRSGAPMPEILGQPRNRELWLVYHEDLKRSRKLRSAIEWVTAAFPGPKRCMCGECAL